jgi:hypothetical protein
MGLASTPLGTPGRRPLPTSTTAAVTTNTATPARYGPGLLREREHDERENCEPPCADPNREDKEAGFLSAKGSEDYYTVPPVQTLQRLSAAELTRMANFTVGHAQHGEVSNRRDEKSNRHSRRV